jgi:hypothetical protein
MSRNQRIDKGKRSIGKKGSVETKLLELRMKLRPRKTRIEASFIDVRMAW